MLKSKNYIKYKNKTPKKLKKVKPIEKPKISLDLSDRLNQIQMWLNKKIISIVGKAIGYIIPTWVWVAFLGVLTSLVIIIWMLK